MSFKKYSLTYDQIYDLANVFYLEQGNVAGVKACASHACNYLEKWQSKKYKDPYNCVLKSGWWGNEGSVRQRMATNKATQAMIDGTRDVIINGNRTLPSYIDEYDWINDIISATNYGKEIANKKDRTQYKKDVTIIKNAYGSLWTFYCFPDGVNGVNDPFGYISKPVSTYLESNDMNEISNGTTLESKEKIAEKAIKWMEDLAANPSHGYSQDKRWGPDYDCSSAVITAWETAGVPVKTKGATYTGDMYNVFISCGFTDVTSKVNLSTGAGLKRSDVLLNHQKHVAMYCGNGKEVEASVNEKGTATGGVPGDQTGKEILVRSYRNFPWNAVLRYGEGSSSSSNSDASSAISNSASSSAISNSENQNDAVFRTSVKLIEVEYGSCNSSVLALQHLLNIYEYEGANYKSLEEDGEFGANTLFALKNFQAAAKLTVDGICGRNTWNKLKEGLKT